MVKQTRQAPGQSAVYTYSTFDQAGRLVATTNELGYATTYAYATNSAGERVVTTTYPDASARIEEADGDRRTVSQCGWGGEGIEVRI